MTTQLVLPKALARRGLSILIVKASLSIINLKVLQNKINKNIHNIFFSNVFINGNKVCLQIPDNCQHKYHLVVPYTCYTSQEEISKLSFITLMLIIELLT